MSFRLGEIEACKLAVVFLRSLVVGLGRGNFVCEISQIQLFAAHAYLRAPRLLSPVLHQADSLISRTARDPALASISIVLCMGGFSQVALSIIDGIAVFMIDHHPVAGVYYLAVHPDYPPLARVGNLHGSYYVKVVAGHESEPFVVLESVVVFGIDLSVSGPGQTNSAEDIPVARPPVEEEGGDEESLKPLS